MAASFEKILKTVFTRQQDTIKRNLADRYFLCA
jgi:hypothetical protein